MLRARIFRSLIIRTGIKERNIRARNKRYNQFSVGSNFQRGVIQYGGLGCIPLFSCKSGKFINSDFRAFCLKKYTIGREDVLLKFKYSSKFWLF